MYLYMNRYKPQTELCPPHFKNSLRLQFPVLPAEGALVSLSPERRSLTVGWSCV